MIQLRPVEMHTGTQSPRDMKVWKGRTGAARGRWMIVRMGSETTALSVSRRLALGATALSVPPVLLILHQEI